MADRPTRTEKEIEITPEMIEAGVEAYCAPWVRDDDAADVVRVVFRAMTLASKGYQSR